MKNAASFVLKTLAILVATIVVAGVVEVCAQPFTWNEGVLSVFGSLEGLLLGGVPFGLYLLFYKKEGWTLGLKHPHGRRQLGLGALLGIGFMVASIAVVSLLGGVQIQGIHPGFKIVNLLLLFVMFFFVSLGEETLFRGVLQGSARHAYGRVAGIIVSSALFFLLHGSNPGIWESPLAPLNLVIAGVILSLIREKGGSLWIPIGFHWTWNVVQDLSGFAVSGNTSKTPLLDTYIIPGKEWLNGGVFGLEGSLIPLSILILGSLYLFMSLRKTDFINRSVQQFE